MLEQNIVFFDWSLQFLKIYLSMIPYVIKQNAKDLINVDAGIPKLDVILFFFHQRQRLCCGWSIQAKGNKATSNTFLSFG